MGWGFYNAAGILKTGSGRELVSSLPSSPVDGQEVFYQASGSMTTDGNVWHLRYRTASANSSKWEFVGGSGIHAAVDTSQTLSTAGTVSDLTTAGPSVTAPVAGTYLVHWGARATAPASNTDMSIWLDKNGSNVGATWYQGVTSLASTPNSAMAQDVLTLAASDVLKVRYYTVNANAAFAFRRITITPVRVG